MDSALQKRLELWQQQRQQCRTDLFYLCREVLFYRDVEEYPHRLMIEPLQKFHGGKDILNPQTGVFQQYTPDVELWHLRGPRNRLMLFPRGHLKTTIITMAHTIQWIINYPWIRILISTAVENQAKSMLREIKGHFQYNPRFRFLFPEICPPEKSVAEFGSQHEFSVPLPKYVLDKQPLRKEPTVSVSSLGKVIAGFHYEVLKFSDMVDKENVKTLNAIEEVIEHFKFCDPLVERSPIPPHYGWQDVEGTRYALGDLYGHIMRTEERAKEKTWVVRIESADPRDRADGKVLWPTRFPAEELARLEGLDPAQYSSQYRQKPLAESSALATRDELAFFPRKALNQVAMRKHVTIDLHGMEEGNRNDYTVLTTCGFDNDGRVYVLDVRRGRFTPFEVIGHIFDLHLRERPLDFKIEKDAHARVLLPFLEREMSKRSLFPVLVPIKRDNRTSKALRIRGLQAWFKAGKIRFSEEIVCVADVIEEILNFGDPSVHDDILDTLADQMQNADGGIEPDLYPAAEREETLAPWSRPKFVGWEDGAPIWYMTHQEEQAGFAGVDKTGL